MIYDDELGLLIDFSSGKLKISVIVMFIVTFEFFISFFGVGGWVGGWGMRILVKIKHFNCLESAIFLVYFLADLGIWLTTSSFLWSYIYLFEVREVLN